MGALKGEKGITMIALTVTIVVIIIITSTMVFNLNNNVSKRKIDNLYSDIEQIREKVSEYYLENGRLPIKGEYCDSTKLVEILKNNGVNSETPMEQILDANDDKTENNNTYCVIDLLKLGGVSLNSGNDFDKWTSGTDLQNIYIINVKSHQIYYPACIKDGKYTYYAYKLDFNGRESQNYNIQDVKINNVNIKNSDTNGKIYIANDCSVNVNTIINFSTGINNKLNNVYYALSKSENTKPEKFQICNFSAQSSTASELIYNANIFTEKLTSGEYFIWLELDDTTGNDKTMQVTKFTIEESKINLTKTGDSEVKITFNPNYLKDLSLGEGSSLEEAKNNLKRVADSTPYEGNTDGTRSYTLAINKSEYLYVTVKDYFGNTAFAYILVQV